jgi:hypothetical protein
MQHAWHYSPQIAASTIAALSERRIFMIGIASEVPAVIDRRYRVAKSNNVAPVPTIQRIATIVS